MSRIGTGAIALILATGASKAVAWEAKGYYPSAISPTMPSTEEAVRVSAQSLTILRPLRHAHSEAKNRGWVGVLPASEADQAQAAQ